MPSAFAPSAASTAKLELQFQQTIQNKQPRTTVSPIKQQRPMTSGSMKSMKPTLFFSKTQSPSRAQVAEASTKKLRRRKSAHVPNNALAADNTAILASKVSREKIMAGGLDVTGGLDFDIGSIHVRAEMRALEEKGIIKKTVGIIGSSGGTGTGLASTVNPNPNPNHFISGTSPADVMRQTSRNYTTNNPSDHVALHSFSENAPASTASLFSEVRGLPQQQHHLTASIKRPANSRSYGQYQELDAGLERSAFEQSDGWEGGGVRALRREVESFMNVIEMPAPPKSDYRRDLESICLQIKNDISSEAHGIRRIIQSTAKNKVFSRQDNKGIDFEEEERADLDENKKLTQTFRGGEDVQLAWITDAPALRKFFEEPPDDSNKLTAHATDKELLNPMSKCVYAQKHLDLTLGKLVRFMSTSNSEFSLVLDRVRGGYASAFQTLRDILFRTCDAPGSPSSSGVLKWLDMVIKGMVEAWGRLEDVERRWSKRERELLEMGVESVNGVREGFRRELEETQNIRAKCKKDVEKMSETVKTLGDIFKSLKTNRSELTDKDAAIQLSDLKKENRELLEKNKAIQISKDAALQAQIKTALAKQELHEVKEELEAAKASIAEKNTQIAELEEEEYQRRLELEKLKIKIDQMSKGDDSDDGEDEDQGGETGAIGVKSSMFMARISTDGVVLWKEPMGEIEDVATELQRARPNHRLLCHGFRLMLPNLRGVRPVRNLSWVRRCMRGIIHAKLADDCMSAAIPSVGETNLIRFPEAVFAWFESSPEKLKPLKSPEERDREYAKVNDDRWGLYYGVKHLAVDDPEASLFYAFLDESRGEDYCHFALQSLQVVEGLGKQLIRNQFGPSIHSIEGSCHSMEILDRAVCGLGYTMDHEKKNEKIGEEKKDFYSAGGAQAIWIPVRILKVAVRVCLDTVDGEKVEKAIAKTIEMSVEATDRLSPSDIVWEQNNAVWDAIKADDESSVAEGSLAELSFNDESSLDSLGLSKRPPPEELPIPMVCNLFLWMRMILDVYEKETKMRKAAIRVMFETAATGALTDEMPLGESMKKVVTEFGDKEDKYIDLPQFLAISRTIYPLVSTSEAAACYREAYSVLFPPSKNHLPAPPGINFDSFLQAAETRQWFSKSSKLSSYICSEQTEHIPNSIAQKLRSLVHMHSEQLKPTTALLKKSSTDLTRWKLELMEKEIDRCLFDNFANVGNYGLGGKVSALRPLCAYRRLLMFLLQNRYLRHEKGDGFVIGTSHAAELQHEIENLNENASVSSKRLLKRQQSIMRSSGSLIVEENELHCIDPQQVMAQSILELDNLRTIIMDFIPNKRIQALNLIKESTAAVRLQRSWRRKLRRELGPPTSIRIIMRDGYIAGMGDIRLRRVYRPIWWTQSMIGEILTTYLQTCAASSAVCHAPPSLPVVIYRFFLNRWGCNSLAERDCHDFFLNLRSLASFNSRARLLAAFCRTDVQDLTKDQQRVAEELGHSMDDFHFYIRCILLVHQSHLKFLQLQSQKMNNNYSPSKFFWIFPVTGLKNDFRGGDEWAVPVTVALEVTKILFQKVYDKISKSEDKAGHISFSKLLQKIQDLARGNARLVDVDDWSWEIMEHYIEIKKKREAKSREISHNTSDEKKAGREIITSFGRYKSHSMDFHADEDDRNDHQDLSDLIGSAPPRRRTRIEEHPALPAGRGEEKKSDDPSEAVDGESDEHHEYHAKHTRDLHEDFEHTKLYEEALMSMQNKNYSACDAVAESLLKHMMSDLDLPLPLHHALPVSNAEAVAKQLILAWSGFVRPMGFLKDEILGDMENGSKKEEVELLFSELDYFASCIEKLQKMVGYDGNDSAADNGGTGSRPMTAENSILGDVQKREMQTLSTKTWLLLRHLCSNVKTTYCHEAALIENEELAGTKRDPLLNLDHPLKDAWSVGKAP